MKPAHRTAQKRLGETMRNPSKYTLGTASIATGKAKSTILRAIKSGNISAAKKQNGSYEIDPAELHRVFPATSAEHASETQQNTTEDTNQTLKARLSILETERLRERQQLQDTIDDLRERLDKSEQRVTALLAAPVKPSWLKFFSKL